MPAVRIRFWIETVAAVAAGLLAVLTIFVPDWIELTGWDPDHRSGAAEWWVVVVLGVVAVAAGIGARLEWRHATGTWSGRRPTPARPPGTAGTPGSDCASNAPRTSGRT